jgi:hypothetical protein
MKLRSDRTRCVGWAKRKRAHRFLVIAISMVGTALSRLCPRYNPDSHRPLRHIGRAQARLKTAGLVEAMHARIAAAALQEDVEAILLPG